MLLHDFIYEWDGKSQDGEKPVSWWPGSYHVKIIKQSSDNKNIRFLVPTYVILKNARINPTMNTSLKNHLYTFALKISKQYDLDMKKTLWIEIDDTIRVTRIQPDERELDPTLFSIPWRDIRPNELEMIKPYLEGM